MDRLLLSATAQSAATGTAAIAAQSLKFAPMALRPMSYQRWRAESKSTPSMSMSVVQSKLGSPGCRVAMSSPNGTAARFSPDGGCPSAVVAASSRLRRRMSSSSPLDESPCELMVGDQFFPVLWWPHVGPPARRARARHCPAPPAHTLPPDAAARPALLK